jgi:hypothetical protein
MPNQVLCWSLVAWLIAMTATLRGEEPKPQATRTEALIEQLGSAEFAERESATDELTRMGLAAFSALETAATHPDREVRFRVQRILGTIRELDLQRRLDAFLAGKEEGEYALPGWSRFKKSYGDDGAARQLFVELQRTDGDLMRALEDNPRSAADLLLARTQQQQLLQRSGMQSMSLPQIVSWLFVASEEDVALQTQTMSMVFNACHHQALRDALNDPKRKAIPRKMLGSVIRRSEDWAAYNAMILATNFELEEGLIPAEKILKNGAGAPHMSQYALMTVARLGNESHLPLVEKLLEDQGVVTQMQQDKVKWVVQVRDAALATAVLLTKQDFKDYFTGRPELPAGSNLQQVFFNPRLIGFEDDQQRSAVFKKWTEYKAKHQTQE